MDITHADRGALYLRTEDDTLKFVIMRTTCLNIAMGGTAGVPIPFPKHLKRVAEYAGGHHEKIDGTRYPNKLKGEDLF